MARRTHPHRVITPSKHHPGSVARYAVNVHLRVGGCRIHRERLSHFGKFHRNTRRRPALMMHIHHLRLVSRRTDAHTEIAALQLHPVRVREARMHELHLRVGRRRNHRERPCARLRQRHKLDSVALVHPSSHHQPFSLGVITRAAHFQNVVPCWKPHACVIVISPYAGGQAHLNLGVCRL